MADTPQSSSLSDVAKPGTTPADATSRPVIVGHGVTVADPMVSTDKPATKDAAPTGSGSTKNKLAPVSSGEDVKKDAAEDEDKKLAEQTVEKQPTELDKQARLGELIESGEYNVTIKQASGGSAKTFFVTILAVLLFGALAVYILADLEIIDIGLELPFELFK
jgi:hypothetical protein